MQTNKVLIVGATSAIATEVGRIYASRKWEIYMVGRSMEKMQILAKDFEARGAISTKAYCFDFSTSRDYEEIVNWATENGSIDLALIAHGVLSDQKACELSNEAALTAFQVNFLSYMGLLNLLANKMAAQKKGTLAAISSVAGDRGRQSNYFYGTAKGALSIYCQGLRNRLFSSNVHVLTIKPGFVNSPMTSHLKQGPLFVEPDKIAKDIVKAIQHKKNEIYTPWFWSLIMAIIKRIPENIFKRLKL